MNTGWCLVFIRISSHMIWIDRNHPYFYFVSVSQCKARLACIPTCSCVFISTRKMYLYFPGWPHALVGKQQRRHKERLASGDCSSADRHLFVKQSNIIAIEISHKYKYIYKGVIRNIRQHCGWFWDYHHQWGDRTIYSAWCSTWLVLHIVFFLLSIIQSSVRWFSWQLNVSLCRGGGDGTESEAYYKANHWAFNSFPNAAIRCLRM